MSVIRKADRHIRLPSAGNDPEIVGLYEPAATLRTETKHYLPESDDFCHKLKIKVSFCIIIGNILHHLVEERQFGSRKSSALHILSN